MKILVTGASGFIGKSLVKALNGEIITLSRTKHPNLKTIICDLSTDSIPSLRGIDIVYHLAGLAHDLGEDKKNEEEYYQLNVEATIRLAKEAIKSNVKKFIFISSVKAGGTRKSGTCASETSLNVPEGVYGKTKFEAEKRLFHLVRNTSMHTSIIRPSLVYGPNAKGNLKQLTLAIKTRFMPRFPETYNKKSMIHIDDLIRAIIFVSKNTNCDREIFIATDERTYSTCEILAIISKSQGIPLLKWTISMNFLNFLGSLSTKFKYKINKLMCSDCYSSDKLRELGFLTTKTLININETDF